MGKSKKRKKAKSQAAAPETKGKAKRSLIKFAVFASLIGAAGWWWYGNQQAEELFFDHVRQGAGTLDRVERHADHGTSGHLTPGERVNYGTNTPTSGRHDGRPVTPGVYTSVQAPTMLVHSLEHGLVVVYYDRLSADALATLEDWSGLYAVNFGGRPRGYIQRGDSPELQLGVTEIIKPEQHNSV